MKKTKRKFFAVVSLIISISLLFLIGVNAEDANKGNKILEIRVVYDHPGVVGYDLVYTFMALYGEEGDLDRLKSDDFVLSCDVKEVIINENKVTIPASFKDNTDLEGFNVYARHKTDTSVTASYPIALKKWELTNSDEFDGTEIDTSKWFVGNTDNSTPGDVGGGKTWLTSAAGVRVENGCAVLSVLDNQNRDKSSEDADFLAGSLSSKFSQVEGLFVSSIKMPSKGGVNSAYWLLPTSANWGNAHFARIRAGKYEGLLDGEPDIIEYSPNWKNSMGEPIYWIHDHLWNAADFSYADSIPKEVVNEKLPGVGFINYAFAWTPIGLYHYCDGELQSVVKNTKTINEPAKVAYTLGGGSYHGLNDAWAGPFYEEDLPMQTFVDYFRLYK